MAGFVIHLAVGKVYEKNNKIDNLIEFERGIIAPDLLADKSKSHYGLYSSQPGLNEFIRTNKNFDEYTEGYFLHLLTDYLFYNRLLTRWDKSIYEDYNKLNYVISNKYGVTIPKEIQDIVKFENGKPNILEEDKLCGFIEAVGRINIRKLIQIKDINFKEIEL